VQGRVTTTALRATGDASASPVPRDTTHLVTARGGGQIDDFSPVPGAQAGTMVSIVVATMGGQLMARALLPAGSGPSATLVAVAVMLVLVIPRLIHGPFLMHRWLMGRPSRRLRGTVEVAAGAASAPTIAPTVDRQAVLVRTIFSEARRDGSPLHAFVEEVRGVPFLLRLPDGRAARVEPTEIHLLEKPRRLPNVSTAARQALGAPWRGRSRQTVWQTSLHPGDQLEVVGRLESVVDQAGLAGPARGIPMLMLLRPRAGRLIWARRLTG
jgi:hypothetical protein